MGEHLHIPELPGAGKRADVDLNEVSAAPMLRRHPWETARLAFFGRVLRWAGTLRTGARVLDVGAGDAWFASAVAALPERPSVVAWDVAYQRGQRPPATGPVEMADRAPTEAFDVVMLMDVLEHVDDDVGFLSEI